MNYNPNSIIKICEFCGDEFESHHGLQRYCPEKYGRKNYCKNEQKKLVNERKLADLVMDVSAAIYTIEPVSNKLESNIRILSGLLSNRDSIKITNVKLDNLDYEVSYYTSKQINKSTGLIEILVGPYTLEWIDNTGEELIFNLKKS